MKAILKKPQGLPVVLDVDADLDSIYRVLDCEEIEAVQIVPNTVAYIDGVGKLVRKMPNLRFGDHDALVGNVLVFGVSGEDERDLSEDETKQVLKWMDENALSITEAFDVVFSGAGFVVSWEG